MKLRIVLCIFFFTLLAGLAGAQDTALFGYYYGVGTYTGTTKLHDISSYSNIIFVSTLTQLNAAGQYGMKGIIILSGTFWDFSNPYGDGKARLHTDWENRWNQKWNELSPYLSQIGALYPVDEPDINVRPGDYELVVNAIQEKLNSAGSDIPILMVVSFLGVPRIRGGDLVVPSNVDWLGFDEYGCWDSCYQSIPITDKLDILIEVMKSRGGEVILIPDGYHAGQTVPSESEQQELVARNQNFLDLCASRESCKGMVAFLWPSFPIDNIIGVQDMPLVEADLLRMGTLVKKGLVKNGAYLGELVSQGKSVTASASHPSTPAYLAVDGVTGAGGWNAGALAAQWIEVDLGEEIEVSGVRLFTTQSPSGFTIHKVFVAGDVKQYTLVHEFKSNTTNSELLQKSFYPALSPVRYVKIETAQSPSWVAWSEVQIFNPKESPGPLTCAEQGGDICAADEVCPGELLNASDSDNCCSTECEADFDLNSDGGVDISDVLVLVGHWGETSGGTGDLNNDNKVNIWDLVLLARNIGE